MSVKVELINVEQRFGWHTLGIFCIDYLHQKADKLGCLALWMDTSAAAPVGFLAQLTPSRAFLVSFVIEVLV